MSCLKIVSNFLQIRSEKSLIFPKYFCGRCVSALLRLLKILLSRLILRNVVEGQGVEFMYNMYSPTVVKIEVLRLRLAHCSSG